MLKHLLCENTHNNTLPKYRCSFYRVFGTFYILFNNFWYFLCTISWNNLFVYFCWALSKFNVLFDIFYVPSWYISCNFCYLLYSYWYMFFVTFCVHIGAICTYLYILCNLLVHIIYILFGTFYLLFCNTLCLFLVNFMYIFFNILCTFLIHFIKIC